ncbi:MAG: pyridoxamine 5'-phosphate oxidase family protein [Caldilineae bacterium]|nr:MAG: pyridoxamine 5'-phosphate oxidase family protein [Caldilineae bacterium]
MPARAEDTPLNQIRRSDRAITDPAWIIAFLQRAPVGVVATACDNKPFLNTNLFVYDNERHLIYFHTALKGQTRTNIERNPQVCFSAFEMGRLLPADVALDFSVEYASVVVFGSATIVEEEEEALRALQMLLDKYFPHLRAGSDYRPPVEEELRRTSVYRLEIESWSAKRKVVEADFPGAFYYAD